MNIAQFSGISGVPRPSSVYGTLKTKKMQSTSARSTSFAGSDSTVKTAEDAFHSENYELAVDLYARTLREQGANVHLLRAYGDALAKARKLQEALDVYAHCFVVGEVSRAHLQHLAKSLVEPWLANSYSVKNASQSDPFSCSKCAGVLYEPITIWCGHTYCKRCISKDNASTCVKCGRKQYSISVNQNSLKTDVLVSNLVEKWWGKEVRAVTLRNEGNSHFQQDQLEEAVERYMEAYELAPDDHLNLGNRCHALHKLGRHEEALDVSESVVRLRPDWPKGYYRRGSVLMSLGRYEDALVSFLCCAALENGGLRAFIDDITNALHKLLSVMAVPKRRVSPFAQRKSSSRVQKSIRSTPSQKHSRRSTPSHLPLDLHSEDSDRLGADSEESLSSSESGVVNRSIPVIKRNPRLHNLVGRLSAEMEKLTQLTFETKKLHVPEDAVDKADFECTLCYRLLWQPVTTPCGHTYCRTCLDRCLDHNPSCPLCKTSLQDYLAERRQSITSFVETAMSTYLKEEYEERRKVHEDEMTELASSTEVPIFVCTVSFPHVPCPLHVFEPRYRLMIRRCMEAGTREFGMCAYMEGQSNGFSDIGTMLEVRDVQFFPDGRSVLDTVGGRRFRVVSRGVRDGYNTAKVEYLVDKNVEAQRVEFVSRLHQVVRESAETWLNEMSPNMRQRITTHFGALPVVEPNWLTLPNGPAWLWWLLAILPLETRAQLAIMGMTSVEKRLEAIQRVLNFVRRRQS